jgi:hypothetical protein
VALADTADGSGDLLIADIYNWPGRIWHVNSSDGTIWAIAGTGSRADRSDCSQDDGIPALAACATPERLSVHPVVGDIYYSDYFADGQTRLRVLWANDSTVHTLWTLQLQHAFTGLAVDVCGNVVFTLEYDDDRPGPFSNRVMMLTPSGAMVVLGGGGVQTEDGLLAVAASLASPMDVTVDQRVVDSDIWFVEAATRRIRKIIRLQSNQVGTVTTVVGYSNTTGCETATSAWQVCMNPRGPVLGADGWLYFTDGQSRRVLRQMDTLVAPYFGRGRDYSCLDGALATGACYDWPFGLAYDTNTNDVYLSTNAHIHRISGMTGRTYIVAGNGLEGYSGDGGPASNASLNNPLGIARTQNGDLLIADQVNNKIRMVRAASGIIETVVGSGYRSFCGDGLLADSLRTCLDHPSYVVVSSSGDIFISGTGREASD